MTMSMAESDRRIGEALRAAGLIDEARAHDPYAAKTESEALEQRARTIERQAQDLKALRAFVRSIWDEVYAEHRTPRTIEDVRAVVDESLADDALFDTCDECGGSGEIVDEIPDEFGTQRIRGGCTGCMNGRVPR